MFVTVLMLEISTEVSMLTSSPHPRSKALVLAVQELPAPGQLAA